MTKTRVGSVFFLLFSILYFYQSYNIHLLPGAHYDAMTARTFPFYLGILGICISILMFGLSFLESSEKDIFDFENLKTYDFKKGVYFILAMLLYGFTIRTLGFIISTIIFLIIGFKILEEKRWKIILLTSFGVSIVFWFLLTQVLGIYIEQGLIFDYLLGAAK
ncbi:tripartite tricarboxylate transporter TctB family protein [Sulfurospirillum sp. 1307]|jgi:putative tricarboxylic transport membrane protein